MKRVSTLLLQLLVTLALTVGLSRWLYNSPHLTPIYDAPSIQRFFGWLFRITNATDCEARDDTLILFLLGLSLLVTAIVVAGLFRIASLRQNRRHKNDTPA